MNLGAFSISLCVRDLVVSKAFYASLGFQPIGGNADQNWLILRNGDHVIGLFQGMLERNTLTFNPGWDQQGSETETFTDVRALQRELKKQGVLLTNQVDEGTEGPGSFMVLDPDGNPILVDQHR